MSDESADDRREDKVTTVSSSSSSESELRSLGTEKKTLWNRKWELSN